MFLFIFESIGTSELLLIGVVALIFLGPRKLPQMARTIGKSMAEFRKATNEFKSTWEREVDLEIYDPEEGAQPIARVTTTETATVVTESMNPPEIKPVDEEQLKTIMPAPTASGSEPVTAPDSDKRSWL
jgi:Tat protein translocase TatB subunit